MVIASRLPWTGYPVRRFQCDSPPQNLSPDYPDFKRCSGQARQSCTAADLVRKISGGSNRPYICIKRNRGAVLPHPPHHTHPCCLGSPAADCGFIDSCFVRKPRGTNVPLFKLFNAEPQDVFPGWDAGVSPQTFCVRYCCYPQTSYPFFYRD